MFDREPEKNEKGRYRCDCCGEFTLKKPYDDRTRCKKCGWINDYFMWKYPDEEDGPNPVSLEEAQFNWSKGIPVR